MFSCLLYKLFLLRKNSKYPISWSHIMIYIHRCSIYPYHWITLIVNVEQVLAHNLRYHRFLSFLSRSKPSQSEENCQRWPQQKAISNLQQKRDDYVPQFYAFALCSRHMFAKMFHLEIQNTSGALTLFWGRHLMLQLKIQLFKFSLCLGELHMDGVLLRPAVCRLGTPAFLHRVQVVDTVRNESILWARLNVSQLQVPSFHNIVNYDTAKRMGNDWNIPVVFERRIPR